MKGKTAATNFTNSVSGGHGLFSPPRRSFTERTEEIGTRKNIYDRSEVTDERGFCWRRMVGVWIARAFAAVFA